MYDYSNILSSVNLVVLDLLGPSVSTTSAEASKTITTMCLHVYYMSRQKIKKPPEVVRQQLPCVPGDQSEHQLPVWEREVHLFCPGGSKSVFLEKHVLHLRANGTRWPRTWLLLIALRGTNMSHMS